MVFQIIDAYVYSSNRISRCVGTFDPLHFTHLVPSAWCFTNTVHQIEITKIDLQVQLHCFCLFTHSNITV